VEVASANQMSTKKRGGSSKKSTECEPIGKLQSNLIHAFCQCAEEVKRYFTSQKLKEPASCFLLRQEFLHYFIHITQRNAFSQGYTDLRNP
jgi:hypothetical protein